MVSSETTFDPIFDDEEETNPYKKQYDYRDSTKTDEEKIHLEKRRRHQIYMLLDYTLSVVRYTDFFSNDTVKLVRQAKTLAQCTNAKLFTSEFLLLPFLDVEFDISKILKEELDAKRIGRMITKSNKLVRRPFTERMLYFFTRKFRNENNLSFFKNRFTNVNIKYSYDINKLFEQTAENALTRFKTPVITPEILFITMMEAKKKKVGKIIKKFLKNETDWYVLRYKLIKRIHYQEAAIRGNVKKNQHYFAYLLKLNLSEIEFNRLIERELIDLGVSTFRNRVVRQLLTLNLFDIVEKDIYKSIRMNSTRKYSE